MGVTHLQENKDLVIMPYSQTTDLIFSYISSFKSQIIFSKLTSLAWKKKSSGEKIYSSVRIQAEVQSIAGINCITGHRFYRIWPWSPHWLWAWAYDCVSSWIRTPLTWGEACELPFSSSCSLPSLLEQGTEPGWPSCTNPGLDMTEGSAKVRKANM